MTATTEVVTVAKENALQVFSAEQGLDPYLAKIRQEIDGFVPDVSTAKGRKEIASIAYKVAQSKTALDNVGKDLVAELKEVPKKIDAERKRMRDLLDSWKDEVRAPLTAWEEAEAARVARHQEGVDSFRFVVNTDTGAAMLKKLIAEVEEKQVGADWEEYEAEAHRAKAECLATLNTQLESREKHEAELAAIAKFQAEQAVREQKEREERIAREAAEAERVAAEQRAQAERDAVAQRERDAQAAAERRELELKLQAEEAGRLAAQAERDRIAAEQKAEQDRIAAEARHAEDLLRAQEAERRRQKEEAERLEAEAKAREADRAHKGAILKAAKEAILKTGVTEEQAKAIVKMIAAGTVPAVSIKY